MGIYTYCQEMYNSMSGYNEMLFEERNINNSNNNIYQIRNLEVQRERGNFLNINRINNNNQRDVQEGNNNINNRRNQNDDSSDEEDRERNNRRNINRHHFDENLGRNMASRRAKKAMGGAVLGGIWEGITSNFTDAPNKNQNTINKNIENFNNSNINTNKFNNDYNDRNNMLYLNDENIKNTINNKIPGLNDNHKQDLLYDKYINNDINNRYPDLINHDNYKINEKTDIFNKPELEFNDYNNNIINKGILDDINNTGDIYNNNINNNYLYNQNNFNLLDLNKDNLLDKNEIMKGYNLSSNQADQFIKQFDKNNDGFIDLNEYNQIN